MNEFTDEQMIEKIKTFKDACIELRIPERKLTINDSISDIASSADAFFSTVYNNQGAQSTLGT